MGGPGGGYVEEGGEDVRVEEEKMCEWKRIEKYKWKRKKMCEWKRPRAPSVRLMFDDVQAAPAVLSLEGNVRVKVSKCQGEYQSECRSESQSEC